jgi:23S rRNA (adenine2503-C2)-methyltransferase
MTKLAEKSASADGSVKFLFQTEAGNNYEALYFKFSEDGGLPQTPFCCLSSQAGCAVGCAFCATGRLGFRENLKASDLLETAEEILGSLGPDSPPPDVFTFMGMGEPLLNIDSLIEFYAPAMERLSAKSLSLSTIVIPKALLRLAESPANYDLFVSLHSSRLEERRSLIPFFRGYGFRELFGACGAYYQKKLLPFGRKIKFSYLLLSGVNDSDADAARLGRLLKNYLAEGSYRLQLLLYNSVPGGPFERTPVSRAREIRDQLAAAGVDAYLSLSRGADVGGGCGQFAGQRQNLGSALAKRAG